MQDWIDQNLNTSLRDVQNVFQMILSALFHCHANGIVWGGPMLLNSIEIIQDEYDRSIPILGNFDFSFSTSPTTRYDAPECIRDGRKLRTVAADMFYFGQLLCETFSNEHMQCFYDQSLQQISIPTINPRLNCKNLPLLLRSLLSSDPLFRSTSYAFFRHPFFLPENNQNSTHHGKLSISTGASLGQLHGLMCKGLSVVEVDLRTDFVNSLLLSVSKLEADEFQRPLLLVSLKGSSVDGSVDTIFIIERFFRLLKNRGDILRPVYSESVASFNVRNHMIRFYLPSISSSSSTMFMLGRFLLKLIVDGYPIPPVFPSYFYGAVSDETSLTLDDLEYGNVTAAMQQHELSTSPTFAADVLKNSINQHLVQPIKQQIIDFRRGLLTNCPQFLLSLNRFSFLQLIYHGSDMLRFADLSSSNLRRLVFFYNVGADSCLVQNFWSWIESVELEQLRRFVYFATSDYHLPTDMLVTKCGHNRHVLASQPVPSLFIHGSHKHGAVHRTLAHHIVVPLQLEALAFGRAMTSAIALWFDASDTQVRV